VKIGGEWLIPDSAVERIGSGAKIATPTVDAAEAHLRQLGVL
jgi:hypothetical protein